MTDSLDPAFLGALFAAEQARFCAEHPRSAESFELAQAHMLDVVPTSWMTRWASPYPVWVREAHSASFTCVDGRTYIDFRHSEAFREAVVPLLGRGS